MPTPPEPFSRLWEPALVRKIDQDLNRFKQIVRGKIKEDLRKYITHHELIGRKGKNIVSIPLPQIEIPRFKYGKNQKGGVGQGPGNPGDPLQPGEGGQAGDQPGEHLLEVELTLEELAQILGEELALPHIQPKGKKELTSTILRYSGIRRSGPESLRHFKRTFKAALRRQLMSGIYDPDDPIILLFREDKRYRSWKVKQEPDYGAVIIYMMDVSGSMGGEQKEIVRAEAFWIDTWLRSQYKKKLDTRYIVHDAAAKEVDQDTFFRLKESGGTKISSAYQLAHDLLLAHYPPAEWNIYCFHFSDGDNWGGDDTSRCVRLLEDFFLPSINLFCYGQVKSAYGSGQFKKDLDNHFGARDGLITSEIASRDAIMDSIKEFLGKGK